MFSNIVYMEYTLMCSCINSWIYSSSKQESQIILEDSYKSQLILSTGQWKTSTINISFFKKSQKYASIQQG